MSAALAMIMSFGVVVMGIFAFIFLFYTNSFLLKRRKKEIGLYNILGMEKKHIGKILIIENVVISLSSIILGLLCGILFSKLVHLFLSWVFGVEPPFGIEISWFAVIITLALFGVLFVLTMIANLMSIHPVSYTHLWLTTTGKVQSIIVLEQSYDNNNASLANLDGLEPSSFTSSNTILSMKKNSMRLAPINYNADEPEKFEGFIKEYKLAKNVKFYSETVKITVDSENKEINKNIQFAKTTYKKIFPSLTCWTPS